MCGSDHRGEAMSEDVPRRRPAGPRHRPPEGWLFSGVYGLVLASALAAALDQPDERTDPWPDAWWVLLTAAASAAAHGYAHVIAHRVSGTRPPAVRSVLAEWPLLTAVLPTVALLAGAGAGWWPEGTAVNIAFYVNTAVLFCWGAWTARLGGRGWGAAVRAGSLDMLIGLAIIGANALIK
jgi:hypothetical protein